MTPERKDDLFLLDILLAARNIAKFTRDVDYDGFLNDEILQNAIYRLVIVIGEAASQVSDERRSLLPSIPWSQIVGMRHKLVHHYFRIDAFQVWDVIENHLGPLIATLEPDLPTGPYGSDHGHC